MKIFLIAIIMSLVLLGCKSKKEVSLMYNNSPSQEEPVKESIRVEIEEAAITVKEEYVTAVEKSEPILADENFFIIMGSFKVLNNAKKFQNQLFDEGFDSQILQNENGLFRVSVLSYKEITEARKKVLTIRKGYPKYQDVWLLRKQV